MPKIISSFASSQSPPGTATHKNGFQTLLRRNPCQKPRLSKLKIVLFLIIFIICHCLISAAAKAADYQLNQETVASGGSSASSTNYQINSIIGQPGAGRSISENYIFDHGFFWLATPSEPEIEIQPRPTGNPGSHITVQTATGAPEIIIIPPSDATTTIPGGVEEPSQPPKIIPSPKDYECRPISGPEATATPDQVCQQPTATTKIKTKIQTQLQTLTNFIAQRSANLTLTLNCLFILLLLIAIILIIIALKDKQKLKHLYRRILIIVALIIFIGLILIVFILSGIFK